MTSLLGKTIIQPSDLSAAHRFRQDVAKNNEEEERVVLLENLRRELKAKHREVYSLQTELCKKLFELNKVDFVRKMEKAWLTNEIIRERCHTDTLHPDLKEKASAFNRQIDAAISLGLEGYMFGPSKKRKAVPVQEEEEASDKELEELRDLKIHNEELILHTVDTNKEELREKCRIIYTRARPFAKLEAREEFLSSMVKSFLERKACEPFIPTKLEILGYMLLEETVTTTLHHPYIFFPSLTPNTAKLQNTTTLASIRGEQHEARPKIQVTIDCPLFSVNDKTSFETLLASDYDTLLMDAKSAGNDSEMDQIKWMTSKVEEWIELGKESCFEVVPGLISEMSLRRPFESQLIVYCEGLSDMRFGRCLKSFSETETKRLEEIQRLARNAIDKYKQAKGADSIPVITEPVLPTFHATV